MIRISHETALLLRRLGEAKAEKPTLPSKPSKPKQRGRHDAASYAKASASMLKFYAERKAKKEAAAKAKEEELIDA